MTRGAARLKALPAMAALAALAAIISCRTVDRPGSFMSVDADTSWAAFDSLVLTLRDAEGGILDTLYHARYRSQRDLENLPAAYEGGKVTVVLEGYLGGRAVKREYREYDGRTGELYAIRVENPPQGPSAETPLDIRPDSVILYLGGRKEVVGPGSAWTGALEWSVGEKGIATVREGELTAVSTGRTYVKAKAADGRADSSWIQVVRDPPVLGAGTDTSVTVNARVSWVVRVAQAHGHVEMFKWDTDGDGSWDDSAGAFPAGQAALAAPERLYDRAARLTLRFYARDGEKNEETAVRPLTVASKVPAIDSLGAKPALAGIGDTVRFSARARAGEGAVQSYAWDLDGNGAPDDTGSFGGAAASLTAARAFAYPGLYRASLKLTDGLGSSVSRTVDVDVRRASPTADAGPDLKAKVGTTVNLAGAGSDSLDGRIVAREWILGTAEPVRADSLGRYSFTARIPGMLMCIFRVTDDDGLVDEDTARVEIVDGKAPDAWFTTASDTLTLRDSMSFTVKAKSGDAKLARYAWDFQGDGKWDDSGTVAQDSLTHTRGFRFDRAGSYLAAFRIVDAAGAAATAQLPVLVKEDRPWAKAGDDTTVRLGDRVVLRGQGGDTLGTVVKREWKVGDSAFVETPGGDIAFVPGTVGDLICVFRVTDDDNQTAQATRRVTVEASSEAVLSGLALAWGAARPSIQPIFTAERKSYSASVPFGIDSIRIVPTTPAGSGATIRVKSSAVVSGTPSQPIALAVGTNSLAVLVTAQDGVTVATYTIIVTRAPNRDAALKSIVPSDGTLDPAFDTAVASYDLKLDSTVDKISLVLSPKFPTTTLTVDGAAATPDVPYGPIALGMGKNLVTVTATAQSGDTRTYAIWVTRGPWLFVFDNFNARSPTSALDTYWGYFGDHIDSGNSVITSGDISKIPTQFNDSSFATGRDGLTAARMAFVYGDKPPRTCGGTCAYGQFVTLSNAGFPGVDISDATHIVFYARASSPMRVRFKVLTANILDFAYYRADVDFTTQWVRYVLPLKSGTGGFKQPSWSTDPKPFDLSKFTGFHWEVSKEENSALDQGTLWVDDIVIQGWRGP